MIKSICILLLAYFVSLKGNSIRYGYKTKNAENSDTLNTNKPPTTICKLRCEVSQVIYNDELERALFICRRKRSSRDVTSLFTTSKKALIIIAVVTFCPFLLLIYCCCTTCCNGETNNSKTIQMALRNDSSQNDFNKQLTSSHVMQTDDHITQVINL